LCARPGFGLSNEGTDYAHAKRLFTFKWGRFVFRLRIQDRQSGKVNRAHEEEEHTPSTRMGIRTWRSAIADLN